MNRTLLALFLAAGVPGSSLLAQEGMNESDLLRTIESLDTKKTAEVRSGATDAKAPPDAKKKENERQGPTEITCTKEATFDNKTRQAVFVGAVQVKDPQFTLKADKLTAILRDTGAKTAGAPAPPGQSGLERALAEGNVVIVQEKPGENGGPPKRYVGKAERAEYEAKTGAVTLRGWPQVQQGINTQVATEAGTVMILNRAGSMETRGGSKTVIQESTGAE